MSPFLGKGMSCLLSIFLQGLQYWSSMPSNVLASYTSGGFFIEIGGCSISIFFFVLLSSSWVNIYCLMFRLLLIILLLGLSVTFSDIPSRCLKCSYHMCNHSSLQTAFSLPQKVLFLLTNFLYCPLRYHIYQPLRSGRIWREVNFLSGV